jgi:hypothetical protein
MFFVTLANTHLDTHLLFTHTLMHTLTRTAGIYIHDRGSKSGKRVQSNLGSKKNNPNNCTDPNTPNIPDIPYNSTNPTSRCNSNNPFVLLSARPYYLIIMITILKTLKIPIILITRIFSIILIITTLLIVIILITLIVPKI